MTGVADMKVVENMRGVADIKNDVRRKDEDGEKNLVKHRDYQ